MAPGIDDAAKTPVVIVRHCGADGDAQVRSGHDEFADLRVPFQGRQRKKGGCDETIGALDETIFRSSRRNAETVSAY